MPGSWTHKQKLLSLVGGGVALSLIAVFVLTRAVRSAAEPAPADERKWVTVERVYRGDAAEVDPDDELVYAGIRAPYKDEPLADRSRQRNAELVAGRRIRLRFDKKERDKKGRLVGYAFVEGKLVNEILVREGLAYARITPDTRRYAELLLKAQSEARRARRGIWKQRPAHQEREYWADPKYGHFHLLTCAERAKAKPDRIVTLASDREAFDRGLAPCGQCRP